MKKVILIFLAFVFLGVVFFLSEERSDEGLSEINYWKLNPEDIIYLPPNNNEEFANFIQTSLEFKKIETKLKLPSLFIIKGVDFDSKEKYIYEGNYNVKNLFTELSVISTKSIDKASPDILEKFNIVPDSSPSLEILIGSSSEKKLILGEETRDKARRYAMSSQELITAPSHIFQKFSGPVFEFRNRQYTSFGEFELLRIQVQSDDLRITIENNPEIKNGLKNSKWFKLGKGKQLIDPAEGGNLFALLQSFKADKYPDETDGEGFAVSKELASTESFLKLEIFLLNGLHYKIKLFPKVILKNNSYYPVSKEIEKFFIESTSYTSEQSVLQIVDLLNKIQSAPEWTEQKGK